MKLNLKMGFEQAKSTQEFQVLSTIVSYAFGGKKPKPQPVQNFAELEAKFSKMFKKKKNQ